MWKFEDKLHLHLTEVVLHSSSVFPLSLSLTLPVSLTWFVALFLELFPTGAMPSNCPRNWTELSDFRAEPEAAPRCTRCTFRYHSNPETRTVLTVWSELSATASVFIQCNRQIQQFRSCCCTFFYHFSLEVNNSERKKENQDKKKRVRKRTSIWPL